LSTNTTSLRRVVTFISGVAVGLSLLTGVAAAAPTTLHGNDSHTSANPDNLVPQPASTADFTGNGANVHGSYDSTRDGSPSENGNGGGQAVGKPCAGCVGKADNKNPKGQAPDGPTDHNLGYECDGNHGIGRSNPAHTGCTTTSVSGTGGSDSSGSGSTGSGDTNVGGTTVTPPSTDGTPAAPGPVTAANPTDDSAKPVCTGGATEGCTSVEAVTEVRAAPATTPVDHTYTVAAADTARGVTTLPRTGFDPEASVLVALVLLSAGLVLVRKSASGRA